MTMPRFLVAIFALVAWPLAAHAQDDLLLHASFRGTSHGRARIDDG